MGILVGALGALGAVLVPGAVGHGIETHSIIVALAVVAVVLILAYVTNPSAASFRTFLTELAFRRHLNKLHDASDADPPALHWARHSHHIDAAPHLQFATRASVSVRSSAHIFRSFGILTIAAVTPVADHRSVNGGVPGSATAFASDQGRWFLGAFGKWWLGGALLLGKQDDRATTAGLLDIRLLDDSELLAKWTVVPESPARRTPPLPKHASLPLHTAAKQVKQASPKHKPKSTTEAPTPPATTSPSPTPPNINIDAHPLLADLLQHISTTQTTLAATRAQLAQLNASTALTRQQTEEHAAQRAKHNSTSAGSDATKTLTHQLTNARRTLRTSEKALAGIQATHATLEQRAATLTEEAKSLRERVIRDQERVKGGEAKGKLRREEVAQAIGERKEELRRVEEEIGGSCPNAPEGKEVMGLAGRVRALEAEVREARKTLEELRAWQASEGQESRIEDQEETNREKEQEKEKEPGVVYIGQTPVRAVTLSNASQTNPARIHTSVAPHTRNASGPASGLSLSHAAPSITAQNTTTSAPNPNLASTTTVLPGKPGPGFSPTPANANATAPAAGDVSSPARSARSKGYAIFDTDLAGLGPGKPAVGGATGPLTAPTAKGVTGPAVAGTDGPTTLARPTFSPFDSDTLPIPIPGAQRKFGLGSDGKYTIGPDNAKYSPVTAAKFGLPDEFRLGLGMDSPSNGVFSPPPSALLPSSLFSEDGHGNRWDGDAEVESLVSSTSPGQFGNGPSPRQFGNGTSPGQWTNGTSPGQWNGNRNGTSPGRWEKDADGWVNEAKPVPQVNTNGWDVKHSSVNSRDSNHSHDNWGTDADGWVGENGSMRRRWANESSGPGMWAPRTEGRARSVSVESRFDVPAGRPRSDSHDGHRLSSGGDSGYHTATNHSTSVHPKKRHSGSSSGDDVAQDVSSTGLSFAPQFLQHSPVSGSADASVSSFGQGIFSSPSHLSTRRGFDAQRASLPARVPLIREVEESEPAPPAETAVAVATSPSKTRRWFPSVGTKKDEGAMRVANVQGSGLNPDAKAFSFSPDTSKMFNFTRGRTFNMAPPAPVEPTTTSFSSLGLGSANSSTVALGNGGSGGSGAFFSSLLAFAPSPAEREALQRALGTNGITRTLSNTSARSPFTSPLASARSSAVDLSDKAALAWGESPVTPIVQKRTWFPVRKKAAAEETE